jgi:hypothetical protein
MYKKTLLVSGLVLLLISCVFFTGCTDNSSTTNTTTQITSAPGSPKYVTGDIVRNPAYETAYLILGYNSSTDSYKRALIYPNADGSWGYRTNSNTDTVTRTVLEKTNTEKITNKLPSSIVIRRPTTVATTLVTMTTSTTGIATTTTTTTTTPSPTGKPTFKKIVPDFGDAGTAISITSLTGSNFQSGATVALLRADNPNITATNVNVQSPTWITCTFTPPSNATAGTWDVVITNPDGQYVSYSNIFSIHGSATTATTTSPTGSGGITSISPVSTFGNDVPMIIIGEGFQQGFTAKLTKTAGTTVVVDARSVAWESPTQVRAWFTLRTPKQAGTYTVTVTNPDGSTRTLVNGFEQK